MPNRAEDGVKASTCERCGKALSYPKWLIEGRWYCKECYKEEVRI